MPPRLCLFCLRPAVAGTERCSRHGDPTPRTGPRHYDSEHTRLAREVVAEATVCACCGKAPTPQDPLQADHIIPVSEGGLNVRENYQALLRSCNIRKGGRNRKR